MHSATRAAAYLIVLATIGCGLLGLFVGSLQLMCGQDGWALAFGSGGLITAGTLLGNYLERDEAIQDKGNPAR